MPHHQRYTRVARDRRPGRCEESRATLVGVFNRLAHPTLSRANIPERLHARSSRAGILVLRHQPDSISQQADSA